jgi:MOSC domain-containing protein YiiM
MIQHGTVIGLFISDTARALPVAVGSATATAGRGLAGDRYFCQTGSFSSGKPDGRALTLIEKEALEEFEAAHGIGLPPAETRRNVLTEGIALNDLVGKKFYIGEVLAEGVRLCDPCAHLERLTGKPVLKGLENRGGLRANLLSDGVIKVGDSIRLA